MCWIWNFLLFDLPWPCFKFSAGSQWKTTRTEPIWRAFVLQKINYGWWNIMSFFNLQYNWNFICNCVSGRDWAKPFPGFWWTLFTNQCQRNIHTQLGRYRYLFFIIHQYVWVPVDYLTLLASEYFNSTKVSTMYFLICWGYLVVIFLFYYQRPY